MKLLSLPAPVTLLPEALERLKKANPKTFILVYIDPQDDQITVSRAGRTGMEQLGLLEFVKHSILCGD